MNQTPRPLLTPDPIAAQDLVVPAVGALLIAMVAYLVVAVDQGALGALLTDRLADSGGVLHEFFHDARHLLGVPCH